MNSEGKRMKKLKLICSLALLVLFTSNLLVYGMNVTKNIQVAYRNIAIHINGKPIPSEQEPFIYQGRTFVPLRTIGEAFNKKVDWDNINNKVIISDAPTNYLRLDSFQSLMNYLQDEYKTTISDDKLTVEEISQIQDFNNNMYKRVEPQNTVPVINNETFFYKSFILNHGGEVFRVFYFYYIYTDKITNKVSISPSFPCIKYKDGTLYFISLAKTNENLICGSSDGWFTDKKFISKNQTTTDYYLEYLTKINNSILVDKPNRTKQITDLYSLYLWFNVTNLYSEE